jgi:superfamily II DNA or RNA helicase
MRSLPDWPTSRPLRPWQERALHAVHGHRGDSFLASATPAAGKTTFGLRVAHDLLRGGRVARVVVAAPTAHICRQWAADAARYGIDLEPGRPNAAGLEPADRHGVTVTYAAVASAPRLHASGCTRPTLLIADEPHHMGDDAAWGARARQAFGTTTFRLLLSGTPFRSDNTPIPWVTYDDDGVSRADHAYTYTEALLERVCRPVAFHTYDGDMEWTVGGRRRRADFSLALPAQEAARRLRTALDAEGDWLGHVLREADARLGAVRETHRDAGGLVVAMDKDHARSVAARLQRITGEAPPVVTSDDPQASSAIAAFATGTQRWLVSVLMVSEGVDIPRLRVGVYATTARTELFFRQVVGRFIRRSPGPRSQLSHLFMPSDPVLKQLAVQIEEERDHALALETQAEAEAPERAEPTPGEVFQALSSSARTDEAILSTVAPGENLSLFGDPEPAPSPHLAAFATAPSGAPATTGKFSERERLRTQRAALVAALARRTGSSHREINGRINREVGASSVASATLEQLERANRLLERYAAG